MLRHVAANVKFPIFVSVDRHVHEGLAMTRKSGFRGRAHVFVKPAFPDKAEQGHAILRGRLHGQARGRPDRGQDRQARPQGLLDQFKTQPSAAEPDQSGKRQLILQELGPDDLV